MSTKNWGVLLVLAVVLFGVVACSRRTPTPVPTRTPTPTPALTPTATPGPAPTAAITSTPEPPAEEDPAEQFYDLAKEVPPVADFSTQTDFEVAPEDNFSPQVDSAVKPILVEVFGGAKLTRVTNFSPLAPASSILEYVVRRRIKAEDLDSLIAAFERKGYTKTSSSVTGDDIQLQVTKEGLELALTNHGTEQQIEVSGSK